MTDFAVSFDKRLCHGGPDTERFIQQGHFVVTALSAAAAIEVAKRLFAASHRIARWDVHADRIRVVRLTTEPNQGRAALKIA